LSLTRPWVPRADPQAPPDFSDGLPNAARAQSATFVVAGGAARRRIFFLFSFSGPASPSLASLTNRGGGSWARNSSVVNLGHGRRGSIGTRFLRHRSFVCRPFAGGDGSTSDVPARVSPQWATLVVCRSSRSVRLPLMQPLGGHTLHRRGDSPEVVRVPV